MVDGGSVADDGGYSSDGDGTDDDDIGSDGSGVGGSGSDRRSRSLRFRATPSPVFSAAHFLFAKHFNGLTCIVAPAGQPEFISMSITFSYDCGCENVSLFLINFSP